MSSRTAWALAAALAVPEDPFDGTPLRYVPLDTG